MISHDMATLNTPAARAYALAYLRAFKAIIAGNPVYNKPTAEAVKVAEDAK
mgnify:FL=1